MSAESCPLITIGITCYNAEDTIGRALYSASQQDWPNLEIVVVDDASDDASADIITELAQKDVRIRLIRHATNAGYPAAINSIVSSAKGVFIAIFDDDDDNEMHRVSAQYKRLIQFQQQHLGADVLCYAHRRVCINGTEVPSGAVTAIGHTAPEPNGPMVADYLLWHKKRKGYIWGEFGSCTLMTTRETLQKYPLDQNFRRGAEWDLAIRVALDGGYFISVDEPLIIQHKTTSTEKSGKKPLMYVLQLRKKHKAYLVSQKVYLGAIMQAYARFYSFRGERIIAFFYILASCVLSPFQILPYKLKRIFQHSRSCSHGGS